MRKAIGLGVLAIVVATGMVLFSSPTRAARGPLCGFSTLWDCTMPDGSHRMVGGTPCDIQRFEQQTGAHCVPSGL
jgi:hypothetical protein